MAKFRRSVAAVVIATAALAAVPPAPIASATPVEQVCPNGRAPRAGVCPDNDGGAFSISPGGGGNAGSGGLLGRIGDIIGGITGGLL